MGTDSESKRILTVVRGPETDLGLAVIAAVALCGAGLTIAFPDGSPTRPAIPDTGSLEVQCLVSDGPRVRQGFIRAGFDTIEMLPDLNPTAPTNVVTVTSGPEKQDVLQYADPAADALCGAGLTIQYPDGRSYAGDLIHSMMPFSRYGAISQIRQR